MPAIGILGGMGPQASARLYELLISGTKQYNAAAIDSDFPSIVLLNVPVPNFVTNKDHLAPARELLIKSTKILEGAGCTINGIACNTAHILLPDLRASTTVPFLSIPELVNRVVKNNEYKRVGLLATPTTLKASIYDDRIASRVALVRPRIEVALNTEKLIYKQLKGIITPKDRFRFRRLVEDFKTEQNLDAVILGCTELPLVYGTTEDETIIDTLQILCNELLSKYFN